MANPQKENGHTSIANEILEQLARINLAPYQWRTLCVILRKTWGWQKKTDHISITQFQKMTGLKRQHQSRAIKALIERNVITKKGDSYIASYGFQKDYTRWKTITRKGDITNRGDRVSPGKVTKLSPVEVNTKEKINYTKEIPHFESLWTKYPKKIGKQKAQKEYLSSVKTKEDQKNIDLALNNYLASDRVKRGFVKDGANWFKEWGDWINVSGINNHTEIRSGILSQKL